jgi:transcription-repair coupling factor (superfamily II helicase)
MDLGEKTEEGLPVLQEFLHLEYADQAVLYVPVSQLHLIGRYTGVSADEAPLHKLGSAQWDKAKRRAAEQVRDAAAEDVQRGLDTRFATHRKTTKPSPTILGLTKLLTNAPRFTL